MIRHMDVFFSMFKGCVAKSHPFRGPIEWPRLRRQLWRGIVGVSVSWLAIPGHLDQAQIEEWEKDNSWWLGSMLE